MKRYIEGFDKNTGLLVWILQISEEIVKEIGKELDVGDDCDIVMQYDLTGDVLKRAAKLAGFEIRSDLKYELGTSRND